MRLRHLFLPPAFLAVVALLRPVQETLPAPRIRATPIVLPVVPAEPAPPAPKVVSAAPVVPSWKAEIDLRRKVVQRIATLLELAYMALDQGKHQRCATLCGDVLLIDPSYIIALDLRETACRLMHASYASMDWLTVKLDRLEQLTDADSEQPRIPLEQEFRIPDAAAWSVLSQCIQSIPEMGGSAAPQEEVADIERKLRTMVIDLKFTNATLEDVLSFIRDFSGLNILLDAQVRDRVDPDSPVTVWVKEWALGDVLRFLLSPRGMDYHITEEAVVLLTYPAAH